MKRQLKIQAAVAVTCALAMPVHAANTDPVTLRTSGFWTTWYMQSNSAGLPACGMQTIMGWNSGVTGKFIVKYTTQAKLFVQVFKTSWNIPADTRIPVTLQFDNSDPLGTVAVGGPIPGDDSSFVDIAIEPDFNNSFLNLLGSTNTMTLRFTEGSEAPWKFDMGGAREVLVSFRKRVATLAPGTQPYGESRNTTQPFGKSTQAKRDNGGI